MAVAETRGVPRAAYEVQMLYGMGTRVPLLADPRAVALIHVANGAKHYAGIAADPPDPQFQQLTPLGARDVIDPQSNDLVIVATAGMGTALSTEEELAGALLHSLERALYARQAPAEPKARIGIAP